MGIYNGQMIGDGKNLKDSSPSMYQTGHMSLPSNLSYNKTNKLITALFMVTDILDDHEPLRNKLRTLGAEIVSDIYSLTAFPSMHGSIKVSVKVSEVISFLDIALTINIISEMNSSILKKEFLELKSAVEKLIKGPNLWDRQTDLSLFLSEDASPETLPGKNLIPKTIGHVKSTRIGVQRGGTLMKALSDRASGMSHTKPDHDFDRLKHDRRAEIISIIKDTTDELTKKLGFTITDIKDRAKGVLASCGEKTLQRELVSMVQDGVLYKTGSKRWSRYLLKQV